MFNSINVVLIMETDEFYVAFTLFNCQNIVLVLMLKYILRMKLKNLYY